jgi:hypothetical protein
MSFVPPLCVSRIGLSQTWDNYRPYAACMNNFWSVWALACSTLAASEVGITALGPPRSEHPMRLSHIATPSATTHLPKPRHKTT